MNKIKCNRKERKCKNSKRKFQNKNFYKEKKVLR